MVNRGFVIAKIGKKIGTAKTKSQKRKGTGPQGQFPFSNI
jgi:hypothetical protein